MESRPRGLIFRMGKGSIQTKESAKSSDDKKRGKNNGARCIFTFVNFEDKLDMIAIFELVYEGI